MAAEEYGMILVWLRDRSGHGPKVELRKESMKVLVCMTHRRLDGFLSALLKVWPEKMVREGPKTPIILGTEGNDVKISLTPKQ